MAVVAVVVINISFAIVQRWSKTCSVLLYRCTFCLFFFLLCACSSINAQSISDAQQNSYQQSLQNYVGKEAMLLVQQLGSPNTILNEGEYTLYEWNMIEPPDTEFWWIGRKTCITKVFINSITNVVEKFSYSGNSCVPF